MSSLTPAEFSFRFRHDVLLAGLVEAILFGVFTLIVFFTLHQTVLPLSAVSRSRISAPPLQQQILTALMLLMYLCCVAHITVLWTFLIKAFITHGESAESILRVLSTPSVARRTISDGSRGLVMSIGDGILIWRCWHLYSKSWAVIAVPVVFMVAQTGLYLAWVVRGALAIDLTRVLTSKVGIEDLIIAHHSLTLGATVLTTALIIFQIVRMGGFKKYQDIITILVESSALYACAIIVCMPFHSHPRYLDIIPATFLAVVPGITATLIIARVSAGAKHNSHPTNEIELPRSRRQHSVPQSATVVFHRPSGGAGGEWGAASIERRPSSPGVFALTK